MESVWYKTLIRNLFRELYRATTYRSPYIRIPSVSLPYQQRVG